MNWFDISFLTLSHNLSKIVTHQRCVFLRETLDLKHRITLLHTILSVSDEPIQ